MAARLARDLESRAVLVSVGEAAGVFERLDPSRFQDGRRRRRHLRALADAYCFPETSSVRIETGDPAGKLIDVAEREDAELVVLASRLGADEDPPPLGQVARTLMARAPCPVAVVPPAAIPPLEPGGVRAVVCGVAGHETDLDVIRLAADLATRLGASLHAVHATLSRAQLAAVGKAAEMPSADEVRERSEHRLAAALAGAGASAHASVFPLPAVDALQTVAERERAGLVVVGSRAHRQQNDTQEGSVAGRLASDGSTTLVALPPGARLEPGSRHYAAIASWSKP
jgi:nucleotide-binding universal stress UspA family protein